MHVKEHGTAGHDLQDSMVSAMAHH
jgi:hypothetical protein